MKYRAYAKINLSLDVFDVREDGYHDISSIMVPISFYDELKISIADKDTYRCNKSFIRFNEHNSIIKMITILQDKYDLHDHYAIDLNKTVPIKAGLGGGTADAAATLKIFQRLYKLQMSPEEIIDVCLQVGADVPFNYCNMPAVVGGIGDQITPFVMKKQYAVLLVKPKSGVSTRKAYELLDMESCDHPDIERLKGALETGASIKGLLGNSLQQPAFVLNKDILAIQKKLASFGCGEVLMSGSGSTVFCIDEDHSKIRWLYDQLLGSPYYVRLTKTLNH